MPITARTKLGLMLLCCLSILLGGCFDTGENHGSNLLLLNGSLLKGRLSQTPVSLKNAEGLVVWQGRSDGDGVFNAKFSAAGSLLSIVATTDSGSSMRCDAALCDTSDGSFTFGQSIPGKALNAQAFTSVLYRQASGSELSAAVLPSLQVNGLTTMTSALIGDKFEPGLTQARFDQLVHSAAGVVVASLGLRGEMSGSLLQLVLPDLNRSNPLEGLDSRTVVLGLLNGALSATVDGTGRFADALTRYVDNPQDEQAKAILAQRQQQLLSQVQLLLKDYVVLSDPKALAEINTAAQQGIDFELLRTEVDALAVVDGDKPAYWSAQSVYWGGTGQAKSGQWWWVSSRNDDLPQWLELDYSNVFRPTALALAMSYRYQGKSLKLQGLTDDGQWLELLDLAAAEPDDDRTDRRGVRHLFYRLNSGFDGSHFRLISAPTDALWLEYLCLFSASSGQIPVDCRDAPLPQTTKVSSQRLDAANVADGEQGSWWVSELASDQPQWLQLSYSRPVVADKLILSIKQLNQGSGPVLQGSLDGSAWQRIITLDSAPYPGEHVDARGFRHLEVSLDGAGPFQYFRYYSQPTSFLWIEHLALHLAE